MAKLSVFVAHIDQYQDLAGYLKEQLVAAFPDAIEVRISSEIRNKQIAVTAPGPAEAFVRSGIGSLSAGQLQMVRLMMAAEEPKALVLLVGYDAGLRPWINFVAGAGSTLGIPVIALCHGGMVPKALPEPLRCLQALDMTQPDDAAKLFAMLARYAELDERPGLNVVDIAQRFGGTPAGRPGEAPSGEYPWQTTEAKLERWRLRPGAYAGAKLRADIRLGRVHSLVGQWQHIEMVQKVGLEPGASLRVTLHLAPDDYQPFIECLAGNDVAAAIERHTPDGWADVELTHMGAYEWRATRQGDVEKILPLIVVTEFSQHQPAARTE